jgi:hypothetical protein
MHGARKADDRPMWGWAGSIFETDAVCEISYADNKGKHQKKQIIE